ncbi:ATP-binding protein [Luteimicrobium subarcticum]|uniref:Phage shock protein C (PspC) family protein n=1 Tax=Luteimicrobium subarcticum TaxID=620910 RepID=A0A2M8WV81_9MICO|nr:ATP-binding protein [Luteimicrobium subarcticum]PJI94835.1 phage shock protein C (PspC) family protein [Luteimicrobium subarcticum]
MSSASAPPVRPPLLRPEQGRRLGGVCAGVATHLDLPVRTVRLAMVLLGVCGVGVVLYVFWWITVPVGDAAREAHPAGLSRLARRLHTERTVLPVRDVLAGLVLLAVAGLLVAERAGAHVATGWVLPLLVLLAGLALAWGQLDTAQRGRMLSHAGGRTPAGLLRLGGGLLLVLVGALLLVGRSSSASDMARAWVAAVAVLAGAAVVLAPWWLRLVRALGDERAARAREAERADIAAHLHDSVLQTLALIRASATDPDQVARLARAQERELREWLYTDRAESGTSLAQALRELVGEVEDAHATPVEVVVVGDCVPDDDAWALLRATREALLNAVRHGSPPVSVYLEVRADAVEVFVRDRGDGFDVDAVPTDRFGVRESIRGRVQRRGGTAVVESSTGFGTEVRLEMPRRSSESHNQTTEATP